MSRPKLTSVDRCVGHRCTRLRFRDEDRCARCTILHLRFELAEKTENLERFDSLYTALAEDSKRSTEKITRLNKVVSDLTTEAVDLAASKCRLEAELEDKRREFEAATRRGEGFKSGVTHVLDSIFKHKED